MSDPTVPTSPAIPGSPEAVVEYQPKHEPLGKQTVRGGLWTLGGYAGTQVIRLASNLILTRMLAPDLFGVMVVVNTVMIGIRLFSDVGIGPALISNPRGEEEPFLRTAWTTQVIRGFLIWAVAIALAAPVAHYYAAKEPIMGVLAILLPVAGSVAAIEGFRSTSIFRLQRQLKFAPQQLVDLIEIVVVSVGMIAWAAVHKSVWALTIPPLVGSLASTLLSHLLLRDRRDRFGWERESAAYLMRIGRWVFISTALLFLSGQFDRLIFAGLVPAAVLGVYGIATTLALMPTTAVMKVGQSVLFPTFSKVAHDHARFVGVYRRARTMLLTIAATLVACMIAAGPFAVNAMYKSDYADAGWMIQLLALGVWFQVVDATNVAGLLARQHPNWLACGNAVKVVFMFSLVPLAYHFGWGFGGALVALAIADGLRAIASSIGIAFLKIADRRTLTPDLFLPLLAGATGWVGLKLATLPEGSIDAMLGGSGKLHRFLVNGTLATLAAGFVLIVWTPICLWQWKASRRAPA